MRGTDRHARRKEEPRRKTNRARATLDSSSDAIRRFSLWAGQRALTRWGVFSPENRENERRLVVIPCIVSRVHELARAYGLVLSRSRSISDRALFSLGRDTFFRFRGFLSSSFLAR